MLAEDPQKRLTGAESMGRLEELESTVQHSRVLQEHIVNLGMSDKVELGT